jgi:hypothetical protein
MILTEGSKVLHTILIESMIILRLGKYWSYYFYSNNEYFRPFIRIFEYLFYLMNYRFLPKMFKISTTNLIWVEITEYHVLVRVCTQEGQQITKLDFLDFLESLVTILENLPESRQF